MNRSCFFIALVLFMVLFSVSGCSVSDANEKNVAPTTTVSATPTPISTPTPTSTPTPSPMPTMTPEQQEAADLQANIALAPDISGMTKDVQEGEIIYLASADNEYGIEAGKYAGEYNPNVFVDEEKIGCVSLIPIAAEKILIDQLADIPENELKFKILIPVEGDQNVDDEINVIFKDDFYGNKMIVIISEENLDIYNTCPNSDWFLRYPFDNEGSKLVSIINSSSKMTTYENPNKMLKENAMYFLQTTVVANENFNSQDLFESTFGEIFTQTNGKMISIGLADESGTYNLSIEDMVKTDDGVLIGITSEK